MKKENIKSAARLLDRIESVEKKLKQIEKAINDATNPYVNEEDLKEYYDIDFFARKLVSIDNIPISKDTIVAIILILKVDTILLIEQLKLKIKELE